MVRIIGLSVTVSISSVGLISGNRLTGSSFRSNLTLEVAICSLFIAVLQRMVPLKRTILTRRRKIFNSV